MFKRFRKRQPTISGFHCYHTRLPSKYNIFVGCKDVYKFSRGPVTTWHSIKPKDIIDYCSDLHNLYRFIISVEREGRFIYLDRNYKSLKRVNDKLLISYHQNPIEIFNYFDEYQPHLKWELVELQELKTIQPDWKHVGYMNIKLPLFVESIPFDKHYVYFSGYDDFNRIGILKESIANWDEINFEEIERKIKSQWREKNRYKKIDWGVKEVEIHPSGVIRIGSTIWNICVNIKNPYS